MYNSLMTNYTQLLRAHNLKATPQRLAMASIIEFHGHTTIDVLYEEMLRKFDSISLATIYKNIHIMLENSFVQEVKIPHAKSVFELTKEAHSHLVCEECSSIKDITLNIETLSLQVDTMSDFEIHSASVVFNGLCKECIKTTKG